MLVDRTYSIPKAWNAASSDSTLTITRNDQTVDSAVYGTYFTLTDGGQDSKTLTIKAGITDEIFDDTWYLVDTIDGVSKEF